MLNGLAYTLLGVFGAATMMKILARKEDIFVTFLLNILFGGTFFIILNFCEVDLPLNWISGTCITVAGFPGVILLIILKMIFKI